MKFSTIAPALTLVTSTLGAPSLAVKRNPTGSFDIIAYGIEDSYVKLFYSDGLAYAGDSTKWTQGSVTTDVSFVINNSSLTTTATTDGVTIDADTLFYIIPTDNEITPVGFTGSGQETPSGASTDQFLFYGKWLMYLEADNTLSDSFRVKETDVSGIYQFYYDHSNLYNGKDGYISANVQALDV